MNLFRSFLIVLFFTFSLHALVGTDTTYAFPLCEDVNVSSSKVIDIDTNSSCHSISGSVEGDNGPTDVFLFKIVDDLNISYTITNEDTVKDISFSAVDINSSVCGSSIQPLVKNTSYSGTLTVNAASNLPRYIAFYINNTNNQPISYTLNIGIDGNCSGGGVTPPLVTAEFDAVHTTYYSNGLNINIPTQIASRVDNFKILSYETGTTILKDINTTVAVELVDASIGTCATHPPISDFKTWIPFYNANQADLTAISIIAGVIIYDPDAARKFYEKAGKNVKFRISYPTDGSGGAIIMSETVPGKYHLDSFPSYAGNTCVDPFTATTFNPANGNVQGEHTYTQVPEACANAGQSGASAMTQHEVNVCLECIYGTHVAYACSTDNFANRPDNYTTTAISPSPLIAGQDFSLTTQARGYALVPLTGYDGDANVTALIADSTKTCAVPDGNISIGGGVATIYFDGIDTNVTNNIKFGDVGDFNISITDSTWTNVDNNTTKNPSECIEDSDTNIADSDGNIGCLIKTIISPPVVVIPHHFDVNGTLTNGSNGFTYLNNFENNATLDQNISALLNVNVTAKAETNATTLNYSSLCYAKDGNSTITFTFTQPITPTGNLTQLIWYDDHNHTSIDTVSPIASPFTFPQYPAARFTSGVGNLNYRLNFDRNITKVVNPFRMTINDINVTDTPDGVTGTDNSIDNNATYIYGRTHASMQRYDCPTNDADGIECNNKNANIYFESYCFTGCDKNLLPNGSASKRTDDVRWFINAEHNSTNDGNVSIVVQKDGTNIDANDIVDASDNPLGNPSVTTLDYNGGRGYPYRTTMQNGAHPWLIYNENNATATRNEFQVEFNSQGDWTGEHDTNTTTKTPDAVNTNRRIMW